MVVKGMTPSNPVGEHGLGNNVRRGCSEGGPHIQHLPGGRADGVFFCVIVLFAHFFWKEKEWNTSLRSSPCNCVFQASAERASPFLSRGFLFGFSFKQPNPPCLIGKDNRQKHVDSIHKNVIENQSKGTVTNNVQACCPVLIRPEEVHVHTHTHLCTKIVISTGSFPSWKFLLPSDSAGTLPLLQPFLSWLRWQPLRILYSRPFCERGYKNSRKTSGCCSRRALALINVTRDANYP